MRSVLRLYVYGETELGVRAIANLRSLAERELRDSATIEIVDILKSPQAAAEERILATPTLVLVTPTSSRRMVGDLSDAQAVLSCLGLAESDETIVDEAIIPERKGERKGKSR